eukprot:CAMPEP_0175882756 /NCGR_PEP_ID=MMETSP0107_2-20121207/43592_1 /TAXON_ID=195067 ORGANISM="Goniomonas pacifica, Strain CCMP1869" /NCGR_SAMPLE_ID=MMETSP0107_2 /ASSEMBLY_ACC=CAM_ASM_000203 /LENGTH=126 /DNA_ID=CAMNT_0017202731 /DNA_START=590 /DNA_END=966 /DNA_ORIENTATION=+
MPVSDLLPQAGKHTVPVVAPTDTVLQAVREMVSYNVGSALVAEGTDSDSTLCGILTEHDYATKIVLRGTISNNTLVKEAMTPNPVAVVGSTPCAQALEQMVEHDIRHLPVWRGGGESAVPPGVLTA